MPVIVVYNTKKHNSLRFIPLPKFIWLYYRNLVYSFNFFQMKRSTNLLFLTLLLFYLIPVGFTQTFQNTYSSGGIGANNFIEEKTLQLTDGNILHLLGDHRLVKLDASGNVLWSYKADLVGGLELQGNNGVNSGQRFCLMSENPLRIAIVGTTLNDIYEPNITGLTLMVVEEVAGLPVGIVKKTIDCTGPIGGLFCNNLIPLNIIYNTTYDAWFIAGYHYGGPVAGGAAGARFPRGAFWMRVNNDYSIPWFKTLNGNNGFEGLAHGWNYFPKWDFTSDGIITALYQGSVAISEPCCPLITDGAFRPGVMKIDPVTGNITKYIKRSASDSGNEVYSDFYEDGGRIYVLSRNAGGLFPGLHVYDLSISNLLKSVQFYYPLSTTKIDPLSFTKTGTNEFAIIAIGASHPTTLFKYNASSGTVSSLADYLVSYNKVNYQLGNLFLANNSSLALAKTDVNGQGTDVCWLYTPKITALETNPEAFEAERPQETDRVTFFTNPAVVLNTITTKTVQCDPIVFNNAVTFCKGSSTSLCADADATGILWNTGATSTCISVSSAGTFSYTAMSISSPGTTISGTFTVTVATLPTLTTTFPENKCITPQDYSVIGAPAGSTFTWTVPDGTIASGAGTSTITVNWTSITATSLITCLIVTPEGCTTSVKINAIPCCEPTTMIECNNIETDYSSSPVTLSSLIATYNAIPGCNDITTITIGSTTYWDFTGITIEVNTELLVDVNAYFDNVTVQVSPNEKITINSGIELFAQKSIFREKCNYMWDGIYITNSTSTFRAVDCGFRQAQNAVVSNAGGVYNITSTAFGLSQFRTCNVGILVNNQAGINPSVVSGTQFFRPIAFLPPLTGVIRGKAGIFIDGASTGLPGSLTIGDATSAATRNEFKDLTYGIANKYYNITCYNNKFNQILPSISITGMGVNTACIASLGDKLKPITVNVTHPVGSSQINEFKNSTYGVHALNYITYNIFENGFNKVQFPVKSTRPTTGTLQLVDFNFITNFTIGINFVTNSASNFKITRNIMNFGTWLPPSGSGIGNVGIFMNDVVGSAYKAEIDLNDIRNIRTGIWLKNSLSSDLTDPILIDNNDILFASGILPSSTNIHYGIRLERSSDIDVTNSDINKLGAAPTASIVDWLRGISVEYSDHVDIANSIRIRRMGSGVYVFDDCRYTRFACNNFINNYHAYKFSGEVVNGSDAIITHELELTAGVPTPTGDVYSSTVSGFDLTGKIDDQPSSGLDINWYYQTGTTPPTTVDLIPGSITGDAVIATSNPLGCSTILTTPPPLIVRETSTLPIVENSATFENTEAILNSNKYALGYLRRHNLLTLGATDDADYINYHNTKLSYNVGKLQLLNEAVEQSENNLADSINTDLVDSCLIDLQAKMVFDLYTHKYLYDSLSAADSIYLYDLAFASPTLNGFAVHAAQYMLDLDVPYYNGMESRLQEQTQTVQVAENKFLVYPNPAKNELTVEIPVLENTISYEVKLIDQTGKYVLNKTISEKTTLDVSGLSGGIYQVMILQNNTVVDSKKISIAK